MKKLLSMLLALAMLLGCVAFAEGVDYTGTWVLTGAEAEGVQMGPSMLAMIGLNQSFVLNADGTMTMITETPGVDGMERLEETGAWKVTETGIAFVDGVQTIEAVYQNEMLVIYEEASGAVMMYTREGAAPAIDEATGPVALANVDPEAFEGQWLLTSISMMGMEFSAEQMGMYMAFVLADGAGILGTNSTEDGSIATMEVAYTVTEEAGVGTVLAVSNVMEDGSEVQDLMYMAEDGTMFLNEEGIVMVFVKQVAEAAAE